jgi:tetratricopeptide (TPR) repeat protein
VITPKPLRGAGIRLTLLVSLLVSSATPIEAQRRGATSAPATSKAKPKPSTDATSVRAELAAVLLQSRKYTEAAREYRALLARDSSNFEYRLGLARALAWGDKPGEAERELRALQARHLQVLTIDSLLRAVREAMNPRAAEAATWVAERPGYAPYRVAYARALAKERLGRQAAAQYDTLLMGASLGPMPDAMMLRQERAHAYLDVGDFVGGAASLRDILRYSPADTSIRHELAVILVDNQLKSEARAQYDTLLVRAPTPALFTERARLRLSQSDSSGAEADLLASLARGGTGTAYAMLGDLYRERGDYGPAVSMYRLALTKLTDQDGDRLAVIATIAQITREEREVVAFVPAVGDDPGVRFRTEGVGDNLGVHYAASTLRATAPITDAVSGGVVVMQHYIGERSPERSIDLTAVGAEGSLGGEIIYGPFSGRLAMDAGVLHLPSSQFIPIGSATASAWIYAWELAVAETEAPAYPTLLTTTALRPLDGDFDVLTARSTSGTLGGPIGVADVAIATDLTHISDGNRRTTAQAFLRLPLVPGFALVYNGTRIQFSERSTRYWDPIDYSAHLAGVEISTHSVRGLSAAARVLPGIAWSVEAPPPPDGRFRGPISPGNISRAVFQLGGGGELTWRDPRWEGTAAVSYGQGRTGDYRRVGVTLGVRVMP